ncbi:MAG: hypothetical protein PHZ26_01605 [Candidatus Gracilibacteria bacterium]|nr:hypothetical protein [Candidatus Gracilibacteria bacterium]MDD2908429.1 hypothetical protein [Candidatus Gracilibacteria bacterium]
MKTILFRFEKENINYLECNINSGELTIGDKEKIILEPTENKGEKYNVVMGELLKIQLKYKADLLAFQSPGKYMGAIKDEEGFANSAILHLFCYHNKLELLELTPTTIREELKIPSKEFKLLLEAKKGEIISKYKIAKSDKLFDGLVFLSLLKDRLIFNEN